MDRYLVISSDGHVGLPPERYRDYLEAKYHQQFDETVQLEIKAREEHEKRFLIDDFNTKWRARVGDGLEGALRSVMPSGRCSMRARWRVRRVATMRR